MNPPSRHCKHDENNKNDLSQSIDISNYLNNLFIDPTLATTTTDYKERPHVSDKVNLTSIATARDFYDLSNRTILTQRPWKTHPHFFQTVHISLLAFMKMTTHAISGGSIEIMGMLTGYYKDHELIILDCYQLPVVGTESRVNPQNDSYEFMLQYLTLNQKGINRQENIIGWYHSHPGFGCWLSGIDVQTQKLQQGFEDPYVAIVIDSINTLKTGVVDIGAFRTYYDGYNGEELNKDDQAQFGVHAQDYYALNINIFINEYDSKILNQILETQSNTWNVDDDLNSAGGDLECWRQVRNSIKDKHSLFNITYHNLVNSDQSNLYDISIPITNVNEMNKDNHYQFESSSVQLDALAKQKLKKYIESTINDHLFK